MEDEVRRAQEWSVAAVSLPAVEREVGIFRALLKLWPPLVERAKASAFDVPDDGSSNVLKVR
jgi:hypothetical protein